jgi:hypothetical protein
VNARKTLAWLSVGCASFALATSIAVADPVPVNVAQGTLSSSGVVTLLGIPPPNAVYGAYFTSNGTGAASATIFCTLYPTVASAVVLSANLVFAQVGVPAGQTVPIYGIPPTAGAKGSLFTSAVAAGCTTTMGGNTAVSGVTVGLAWL